MTDFRINNWSVFYLPLHQSASLLKQIEPSSCPIVGRSQPSHLVQAAIDTGIVIVQITPNVGNDAAPPLTLCELK